MGLLVNAGYSKIDNGEVTLHDDTRTEAAAACFEAAGIYGVIMVLCLVRYWWTTRQSYDFVS